MNQKILFFAWVIIPFLPACTSTGFNGSANSIIVKTSSSLQPYGTYSLIRSSEWQNGRSRTSPLSRAEIDTKYNTLRFALPIPDGLSGDKPLCLMIVGPAGPVTVRPNASGQERFEFRNPLWEQELQRTTYVRNMEQEIRKLQNEQQAARNRVEKTLQPLKPFGARTPEQCREPQMDSLPERPPDAVVESERPTTSAYVCAAAWKETLGDAAGTFYKLTDRATIWNESSKELQRQKRMNVHIMPPPSELNGLRLAAEQGERFLQYETAISRFGTLTKECENAVIHAFGDETAGWQAHMAEIKAAPQRALQQCQKLANSYIQANGELSNAESNLARANAELERARSNAPRELTTNSLSSFTCR